MPAERLSFQELFTAGTISEPLASVNKAQYKQAEYYFKFKNFDVIGFSEDDEVVGFLQNSNNIDLNFLEKHVIRFNVSDLITANTGLIDCLKLLKKRSYLFVINGSEVEAIITLADVEKPAVRMLLFGLVTFFESNMADLIHKTYPDNKWKRYITEERMIKARHVFKHLIKENKETNLINCTQLCDKTDIFYESESLLNAYMPMSKTKASEFLDDIEDLRNDLAHAQSLIEWFSEKEVIQIIEDLIIVTEQIIKRK